MMEEFKLSESEIYQMARLALAGDRDDAEVYIRKLIRRAESAVPELAERLQKLLTSPKGNGVLRGGGIAMPVDLDSRLELLKSESCPAPAFPIWPRFIRESMEQVVAERRQPAMLAGAGLIPTRSILFTGPPGTGKTMSARWLAATMQMPLLTLDLSAVMSSFLGRTGNNLRTVLDYARDRECVLLLDEFDAIAKRRDDAIEVGELKRLVTVLLQEIDSWPANGILVAATNHADLLDPAIWRRFDLVVKFPLPDADAIQIFVQRLLGNLVSETTTTHAVCAAFHGSSFSDIERALQRCKREALIHGAPLDERLLSAISDISRALHKKERIKFAVDLVNGGVSQRAAQELTGIARETIRKRSTGNDSGGD